MAGGPRGCGYLGRSKKQRGENYMGNCGHLTSQAARANEPWRAHINYMERWLAGDYGRGDGPQGQIPLEGITQNDRNNELPIRRKTG